MSATKLAYLGIVCSLSFKKSEETGQLEDKKKSVRPKKNLFMSLGNRDNIL